MFEQIKDLVYKTFPVLIPECPYRRKCKFSTCESIYCTSSKESRVCGQRKARDRGLVK